jgi:N-methylhydantoinase B
MTPDEPAESSAPEESTADARPGPSLEGVDPVTFQIIKHRLEQVTDEAVEALKRVSGSPNTNEGHDLMVALYTADGDLLTGGVGFLHHYLGASQATKRILDFFGDDIGPGDVFMLNDSYTAAFHPPDVYLVAPIFYEGELQAFAANFVHVTDVGSVDAGGFSPNSTSVFHEGFQTPGLKLVDGGEMREDVLATIKNMSRDPGMLELDLRSQIAANNVANERLVSLFDDYGAATVDAVGEALIDQSETAFRRRLRELPDGRFETRQYVDSFPEDRTFTVQLALTKEGDSLTYDFAGTDEQSEYGLNCTYWATVGGVVAPLLPMLCHDMTWNDGIIRAIDVEAPRGSIVNAERPAPISIATVATLQTCNSLSTLAVSKLVGASDAYADRATGVWHGAHGGYIVEVAQGGQTTVDVITDTFAGAAGARAFADGVDLGGELVNVVSRWANVERHESVLPLVYLYRRFVADSGGAGEYRGGVGHEYAITPYGDDVDTFETVTFGRGVEVPQSTGVFGGYPGSTIEYTAFRDTDLWADGTDYPPTAAQLSDTIQDSAQWGVTTFDTGDVLHVRLPGSGGYGDPLDRPPEKVAGDVRTGRVTPAIARDVYGVPVDAEGSLDGSVERTRDRLRSERLAAADTVGAPVDGVDAADVRPTGDRLGPSLRVVAGDTTTADADRYTACADCGAVLAPTDDNWKHHVAVRTLPVSAAGSAHDADESFELRQFVCSACGCLLDTEVAHEDDPFLESRLL